MNSITSDERTTMRERREALGLSLRELAPRIGVSHAALHRWETGDAALRDIEIRAWRRALTQLESRDRLRKRPRSDAGRQTA